jgi:hypothetical protein
MDHKHKPHDSMRDSTYRHARREMLLSVVACLIAMAWTIGWCAFDAYREPGEPLPLLWGMPRWAVVGVLLPWGLFGVFLVWFGLWFVVDDDLAAEDGPPQEPPQ